jgi:hypothetical protein
MNIEDRQLAHLQYVIGSKLRRAETFFLTWPTTDGSNEGRTVIWMHSGMPLRFEYEQAAPRELNRPWLEAMLIRANSAAGLSPVPEPDETPVRMSRGALAATA